MDEASTHNMILKFDMTTNVQKEERFYKINCNNCLHQEEKNGYKRERKMKFPCRRNSANLED